MSPPDANPGGPSQPPSTTTPPAPPSPARPTPPRTGRWIALAMIVLWVAVIIALYIVIVRLKLGGAEALRSQPAPTQAAP